MSGDPDRPELDEVYELAEMQAALEAHYLEHPDARPSLGDVAVALAEQDGHPLATRPDVLRRAADDIVKVHPEADADDVLEGAETHEGAFPVKPRGIRWLEEQTGETIDMPDAVSAQAQAWASAIVDEWEADRAARGELRRVLRDRYEDGVAAVEDPDLSDQRETDGGQGGHGRH